ncbi:hypothetical protein RRG08_033992 [Elysia crispata]|uniref:C-type lectin domain-containing protein n=1 Tax=Elysia crispata TaxID=231223 RepID=A0AAE1CL87_9GAST|nr:hypothetical protein RRG08_033992 [Elysia crispata]
MKLPQTFVSSSICILIYFLTPHECTADFSCSPGHGWMLRKPFFSTCIKVVTSLKKWGEARKICLAEGGDLVKLSTKADIVFLLDKVLVKTADYWTGLKFSSKENSFTWNDVIAKTLISGWSLVKPGPGNGDLCFFLRTTLIGAFGRDLCTMRKQVICEFPPVCENNTYGPNCSETCSPYCGGGNSSCDRINGSCVFGCIDGYQGALCDSICENNTPSPTETVSSTRVLLRFSTPKTPSLLGELCDSEIKSAPSKTRMHVYTDVAIASSIIFFIVVLCVCIAMVPIDRNMHQTRNSTRRNSSMECEEEPFSFGCITPT